MNDRFSITVPISRPMGLYASLRHPLRMEVFVVVSSTQHEHDAVPVFLGSLFRHGIVYFAGFQSTLWFHSKCFGFHCLPARISEQQSFSKIVISCRGAQRLDFPFFLTAVTPHGSGLPRSAERTPKLPALGVKWVYVTFRSRVV